MEETIVFTSLVENSIPVASVLEFKLGCIISSASTVEASDTADWEITVTPACSASESAC
jgi:hypothetical protein